MQSVFIGREFTRRIECREKSVFLDKKDHRLTTAVLLLIDHNQDLRKEIEKKPPRRTGTEI